MSSFTAALAAGLAGLALFYAVHERRRRAAEATAAAAIVASGSKPGACPVKLVILFSGKRKSGKDYATDRLLEALVQRQAAAGSGERGSTAEIGRLSAPLKRAFADEHGLDYQELLSDGPYKEKLRAAMVTWGEAKRNVDPGYFARLVVGAAKADILIVSDARRATDLDFFRRPASFGYAAAGGAGGCPWQLLTVRVECGVEERGLRGFCYDRTVDAAPSECGLDHVRGWDACLRNDGDAARPAPEGGGAPAERASHTTTPARRGGVTEQIAALAEHAASMLRL